MKPLRPALWSLAFMALSASASLAQQRTFVSGTGNDMNPCTRAAPCRTFTQAISQTSAGGEVVVLDSAGYGPFTITKAITINAPPGVYAGISVFSGDGIDINAGGTDFVILRGLTVNNQGSVESGIVFNSGARLHVENCIVNGFFQGGIGRFSSGIGFLGPGRLEVIDSIMRANFVGIFVEPSSGTAQAAIDHVRLEGNTSGLLATDGSQVTASNCIAADNGGVGIAAFCDTAGSVQLNLDRCVMSNNGTGMDADSAHAGAIQVNVESCVVSGNSTNGISATSESTGVTTVRVSNSDNGTGLINHGSPALLLSRGNNTVEGNGTDTSGTIGSYTAK
jgi:hypothetical protein